MQTLLHFNFPKNILLASASPRRAELLRMLSFDFRIVENQFDEHNFSFETENRAEELAVAKAENYLDKHGIFEDDLLITADTTVQLDEFFFNKPRNAEEAKSFLRTLSGVTHKVTSGVAIYTKEQKIAFSDHTLVTFKDLSEAEIDFYVENFFPLDKAGAYGIQEWIGTIGIEKIEGSYYTVMGLPTHLVNNALMHIKKDIKVQKVNA